jgi:hypothetical protein
MHKQKTENNKTTKRDRAMQIIERQINHGGHNFKFDNGAWVCIWPEDESWEFQSDEDDEESYMSGGYELDGNTVEGYDGCFELPKEVQTALEDYGYKLDL